MRTTLSLGGIAATSILMGAVTSWYVLVALGPGTQTDALVASFALPQLFITIVSASLSHVLVPLLVEDKDQSRQDTWWLVLFVTAAISAVALVLGATAGYWVPVLLPGFSAGARTLTVELTRIQLMGMVFTAASGVLWAAYHARQRFIWSDVSGVIASGVGLGVVVAGLERYGVEIAAWATVIRAAVQMALLAPILGPPVRLADPLSPTVKQAWRRVKPLLVATPYYKLTPLIDRFLASMAPAGGLSLLYTAQQVYGAATQVINSAVSAPMVPVLAQHATAGDWTHFRVCYERRLTALLAITILGVIALIAFGRPLLNLVIGHGGVTADNVTTLWHLLLAGTGILVGGVTGQLLAAAFYAQGDTVVPSRIGITGFTIGTCAKVVGFWQLGVLGMAIGASAHQLFNALVLRVWLARRVRRAAFHGSGGAAGGVRPSSVPDGGPASV